MVLLVAGAAGFILGVVAQARSGYRGRFTHIQRPGLYYGGVATMVGGFFVAGLGYSLVKKR
jgi:hypothetical protein